MLEEAPPLAADRDAVAKNSADGHAMLMLDPNRHGVTPSTSRIQTLTRSLVAVGAFAVGAGHMEQPAVAARVPEPQFGQTIPQKMYNEEIPKNLDLCAVLQDLAGDDSAKAEQAINLFHKYPRCIPGIMGDLQKIIGIHPTSVKTLRVMQVLSALEHIDDAPEGMAYSFLYAMDMQNRIPLCIGILQKFPNNERTFNELKNFLGQYPTALGSTEYGWQKIRTFAQAPTEKQARDILHLTISARKYHNADLQTLDALRKSIVSIMPNVAFAFFTESDPATRAVLLPDLEAQTALRNDLKKWTLGFIADTAHNATEDDLHWSLALLRTHNPSPDELLNLYLLSQNSNLARALQRSFPDLLPKTTVDTLKGVVTRNDDGEKDLKNRARLTRGKCNAIELLAQWRNDDPDHAAAMKVIRDATIYKKPAAYRPEEIEEMEANVRLAALRHVAARLTGDEKTCGTEKDTLLEAMRTDGWSKNRFYAQVRLRERFDRTPWFMDEQWAHLGRAISYGEANLALSDHMDVRGNAEALELAMKEYRQKPLAMLLVAIKLRRGAESRDPVQILRDIANLPDCEEASNEARAALRYQGIPVSSGSR